MTHRSSEAPLFSKGQPLTRAGATRVDLRRWAYVGLALTLLGLAGWLYLEQASEVASFGYEIRQLEDRKERLRRELTALRGDVARRGALGHILDLGKQMGYALPDVTDRSAYMELRYLVAPAPVPEAASQAAVAKPAWSGAQEGGAVGWVRGAVGRLGAWLGVPVDEPIALTEAAAAADEQADVSGDQPAD